MPNMNRLSRRIEQALYSLRREYGGSLDVYKLVSAETDPRTGVASVVHDVTPIKRAIILPGTVAKREIRGISLISANKQLVQGGHWESIDKVFIVLRRDLASNFELSTDDWIVYDSVKYNIDKLQRFEFDVGIIVWCKAVVGDTPHQTHILRAENWLHLGGVVDGES